MQRDGRRRALEHIDRNSPGTMSAYRGERPEETTPAEIDLGDDPPLEMVEALERTGYGPPETRLLPADRFSDETAADWQRKLIHSPTSADCLRERSRAVRFRLSSSCAGWRRPPTPSTGGPPSDRPGKMSREGGLTLPEPCRALWLRTRDLVKTATASGSGAASPR